MEEKREFVTPLDVARKLNVEDKYLSLLTESELEKNRIDEEIKKTMDDFLNSEEVIL